MSRPRILVTLDTGEALRRGVPFPTVELKAAYGHAVEAAGGLPLLVAPTGDPAVVAELIALLDGLVITGGAFDIAPELYGQARGGGRLDPIKPGRTGFELALLRGALARRRPVLAICGGMQLLNVALGGTLLQDIRASRPDALEHEQPTSPAGPAHAVELVAGSALAALAGATRIAVNTTHHQAVDRIGDGLAIVGRSEDGVIEAIALDGGDAVVGVQWHPELLDDAVSRALYARLVEHARAQTRG